jgi:hypothetical protein
MDISAVNPALRAATAKTPAIDLNGCRDLRPAAAR